MQAQPISRNDVLADFANTLNALPGSLIEISRAQPGGSRFDMASYYALVSADQLAEIVQMKLNVGFLPGVDHEELNRVRKSKEPNPLDEVILGELTTRNTKNEIVTQRNIISLEIDFKDVIPGFLTLPAQDKRAIIEQFFEKYHPAIKGNFGDIWIASFSGNSLHMHLKLKSPLDCTDHHRYAHNYDFLVDKFESEIFQGEVKFDRQCKNTARLMRIPYSINLKVADSPIQTGPIYFNPNADVTHAINILWDLADTHREKIEQSAKAFSASSEASDHKSQLKQALTFRKVLEYFHYKKFSSLRDLRNGETQCSSPWKDDRNPSCFLNEGKKQFKDFCSDKCGDIFNFIAEMGNLDIKTQFPSVIAVAETITGIKKVVNMKPHLAVDNERSGYKKKLKPAAEDYFRFFDEHLKKAKRDILSGELMTFHEGAWQPAASRLSVLGSYALDSDFLRKNHLPEYLARYAESKSPELLIDIPQWDGQDRIKTISQCVRMKNCSQSHLEDLLKEWGARLFQRLKNPTVQNRIIIFKGGQGIGKDTLVNALLGDLGPLMTNLTISRNDSDNLAMLADHLVINISEFDRTSRTDASTLKDWITRNEATFRRPYEKAHRRYQLRASFIATVNVDEILRDHSGNRRFIIFDIEKIDWNYPINESLQVLAQFKVLAEQNYQAHTISQEAMKSYIESQTPDDPKEGILECWDNRIANLEEGNPSKNGIFTYSEILPILSDLSKLFGYRSVQPIQTILKTNGRYGRKNNMRFYYRKKNLNETERSKES